MVVVSTSLASLLTQCEGIIYRAMNDRFSGVQNDQTLINSLPIDEMAGRSEIPAFWLETRKYKACSAQALQC